MNPNQVQWPLGGEIDIMENKGSQPTTVSSAVPLAKEPGPLLRPAPLHEPKLHGHERWQPGELYNRFSHLRGGMG